MNEIKSQGTSAKYLTCYSNMEVIHTMDIVTTIVSLFRGKRKAQLWEVLPGINSTGHGDNVCVVGKHSTLRSMAAPVVTMWPLELPGNQAHKWRFPK